MSDKVAIRRAGRIKKVYRFEHRYGGNARKNRRGMQKLRRRSKRQ